MRNESAEFRVWARDHQVVEGYRFNYQPTFHRWLSIVVWLNADGELHHHMTLLPSGMDPQAVGRLEQDGPMDWAAWELLQMILERHEFWRSEGWPVQGGIDGAEWLFLGYREGALKDRYGWNPDEHSPAHDLGWFFFNLIPASFCPVMTLEQALEKMRHRTMTSDTPMVVVY